MTQRAKEDITWGYNGLSVPIEMKVNLLLAMHYRELPMEDKFTR